MFGIPLTPISIADEDPTMTPPTDYDLVVIGAGPAGDSAATLAAIFGHSVLVIERVAAGGTVTTTGGAPTKTLREAVLALTGFHNRHVYGLDRTSISDDALARIRDRTRTVCAVLQDATEAKIRRSGADYLAGQARLGSDCSVMVTPADGSADRAI